MNTEDEGRSGADGRSAAAADRKAAVDEGGAADKNTAADAKLIRLKNILSSYGNLAIAFSGGVDSSLLCAAAHDCLGSAAVAFTIVSPLLPQSELEDARTVAAQLGMRHELIYINSLDEEVLSNPPERCYYCKKRNFTRILEAARGLGIGLLADGDNADDSSDFRPGARAAAELGVRAPLREAGLNKEEIRILSRRYGLPTAEKPSFACLASRFPYGMRIDAAGLRRVEKAEIYLHSLGFSQLRVRSHGDLARIEVAPEERSRLFSLELLDKIDAEFKSLGFLYCCIDAGGYRMGSLNAGLKERGQRK